MKVCIYKECVYWKKLNEKMECPAAEGCPGYTELPQKTCQNCDHEEYCDHCEAGVCGEWRPDLYYKRLMEGIPVT